ncbi:MAG: N-acetylmuramic acid 6-phosphate etherase [Bacteroidota bacterium]
MDKKPTESNSKYDHLEKMSVHDILTNINKEDQLVPLIVQKCIPQIEALVSQIVPRMKEHGRLFYLGAGTSGRLGVVDASECPPTFGVPHELVVGLIAGGDAAIRKAVEFAEDDPEQGWADLNVHHLTSKDTVIGLAASGRTPYVIGAMKEANKLGCLTGCITCNPATQLSKVVEYPVEAVVGPEFVTGSTRLKAGTAQKLILNMISTATMIRLGHVDGNKMIDMQLSNEKLVRRGVEMIMEKCNLSEDQATGLLHKEGSVRAVLEKTLNRR